MGLGGEYLGVSVPAPLALHAGREPTCGVNSRAAVNRRLSTRVRRTWARVGGDGSRRRAERAHSSKARDLCVLCLMERIIIRIVAVVASRLSSSVWGSCPGVLHGELFALALRHTGDRHLVVSSVQRHVRRNPQRSPIGRVPHHVTLHRVAPSLSLPSLLTSSHLKCVWGNASLTADLERLAACVRRFA